SVLAAPTITDTLVLVRTDNGNVTALQRADGSKVWAYDQDSIPTLSLRGDGNLLVSDGKVFFANAAGQLVALQEASGELLWKVPLGKSEGRTEIERLSDADGHVVLGGTTVYAAAYHGNLLAVDTRSSQV